MKSFETIHNHEISPNFLVWKFYGNAQFQQSFGRFVQNPVEPVRFLKMSAPGN